MSWWVSLDDAKGKPLTVGRFEDGGTYVLGGSTEANLNITYNYGEHFRAVFDGMRFRDALDGKRAQDVIPMLERAVQQLGVVRSPDYWEAVAGNAGHALNILLGWARQHPEGRFSVR